MGWIILAAVAVYAVYMQSASSAAYDASINPPEQDDVIQDVFLQAQSAIEDLAGMGPSENLKYSLMSAIADAEGYNGVNPYNGDVISSGSPSDVPTRANNPGDLTDEGDVGNGLIHTQGPHGAGITIYSTAADGWAALYKKVNRMLTGNSRVYLLDMSISQIGFKYAGVPEWGNDVAAYLGTSPETTLRQLTETLS